MVKERLSGGTILRQAKKKTAPTKPKRIRTTTSAVKLAMVSGFINANYHQLRRLSSSTLSNIVSRQGSIGQILDALPNELQPVSSLAVGNLFVGLPKVTSLICNRNTHDAMIGRRGRHFDSDNPTRHNRSYCFGLLGGAFNINIRSDKDAVGLCRHSWFAVLETAQMLMFGSWFLVVRTARTQRRTTTICSVSFLNEQGNVWPNVWVNVFSLNSNPVRPAMLPTV